MSFKKLSVVDIKRNRGKKIEMHSRLFIFLWNPIDIFINGALVTSERDSLETVECVCRIITRSYSSRCVPDPKATG